MNTLSITAAISATCFGVAFGLQMARWERWALDMTAPASAEPRVNFSLLVLAILACSVGAVA